MPLPPNILAAKSAYGAAAARPLGRSDGSCHGTGSDFQRRARACSGEAAGGPDITAGSGAGCTEEPHKLTQGSYEPHRPECTFGPRAVELCRRQAMQPRTICATTGPIRQTGRVGAAPGNAPAMSGNLMCEHRAIGTVDEAAGGRWQIARQHLFLNPVLGVHEGNAACCPQAQARASEAFWFVAPCELRQAGGGRNHPPHPSLNLRALRGRILLAPFALIGLLLVLLWELPRLPHRERWAIRLGLFIAGAMVFFCGLSYVIVRVR